MRDRGIKDCFDSEDDVVATNRLPVLEQLRLQLRHPECLKTPQDIREMLDASRDREGRQHDTPAIVADAMSRLAADLTPQSILDPTCGLGLLLRQLGEQTHAPVMHGIDINDTCAAVSAKLLGDRATIFNADALNPPAGLQDAYDLVVAQMPFGMLVKGDKAAEENAGIRLRSLEARLTVWICNHLSANGRAILVVPPNFLWLQADQIRAAIHAAGCRYRALIHVPNGLLQYTMIDSYIAVFERGPQENVFIGQIADDPKHMDSLVRNFQQHKFGDRTASGRLCDLAEFRGYAALEAKERLKRLVKKISWTEYPADKVIVDVKRIFNKKYADSAPLNSLYVREIGKIFAVEELNPDELASGKSLHYWRLTVDPGYADARYMVHWFNKSAIAREILAMTGSGTLMQRFPARELLETSLFLPLLDEQKIALSGVEKLNAIRAESDELEAILWKGYEKPRLVVQNIDTINHDDRYAAWIETLPFPLASILWRHRAEKGDGRVQLRTMRHFFEAMSAFMATIHLSAFMRDKDIWKDVDKELDEKYRDGFAAERISFGTWRLILDFFSVRCRRMIAKEEEAGLCQRIYGTNNLEIISMLCSQELSDILNIANTIRNEEDAHGGALGNEEALLLVGRLLDQVNRLRTLFGRNWLDYELLIPSDSQFEDGTFYYTFGRIMGTRNSPFESVMHESAFPMNRNRLHLFDRNNQSGLELIPFVKIMESPEKKTTACYMLNKQQEEKSVFVSYHFEKESKIGPESYSDVNEALTKISLMAKGEQP